MDQCALIELACDHNACTACSIQRARIRCLLGIKGVDVNTLTCPAHTNMVNRSPDSITGIVIENRDMWHVSCLFKVGIVMGQEGSSWSATHCDCMDQSCWRERRRFLYLTNASCALLSRRLSHKDVVFNNTHYRRLPNLLFPAHLVHPANVTNPCKFQDKHQNMCVTCCEASPSQGFAFRKS